MASSEPPVSTRPETRNSVPPVPSILPESFDAEDAVRGFGAPVLSAARYPMVMREPTVNPIASATSRPTITLPASGHAPFTFQWWFRLRTWVGFTPASTYDDAFTRTFSYRYVAYAAVPLARTISVVCLTIA